MTPLEFLEGLWKGKPDNLYILIWTLSSKTSNWFRDLEAAAAFVEQHVANVYVGVGLAGQDYGPTNRCRSTEVRGLAGFWADIDLRSDAHDKKTLPVTIEEALSIIPPNFPPSIILTTGNGVHEWWLFEEPWIFENGEERENAAVLSGRFQTLLCYNSNQRGFSFDRLGDLARVLRIPGTINCKDPSNTKQVEAYAINGHRYSPSDFSNYLNSHDIPDPASEDRIAKEIIDRFTDKDLIIDLDATISEENLARWLEKDERFRRTWRKERNDLKDQSQSGYDMALACFGYDEGLTDQEIVNLIIHHRRIHHKPPCKTQDYFKRTIAKAASKVGRTRLPIAPITQPGAFGATPENSHAPHVAVDPNEKAKLCDQISHLLGIRILRLLKISGKDPVYLIELEQGQIEIPSVGKLLTQQFMRNAFAGKVGKVIPKFQSRHWQNLAQMMLDACVVEETSEELEFVGGARITIGQYLADTPFMTLLEGESTPLLRRPLVYEGRIAISASDLQRYMSKTSPPGPSVIAAASMIKGAGGKIVRVRKGRFDQDRWSLPIDNFDPKDYSPDLPEDIDG